MKVCIYGASSETLEAKYYEDARKVGMLLAENGHAIVFGAGNYGLMRACADGAYAKNGEIIGITPRFFESEGFYPHCTELTLTETMEERKAAMIAQSEAFLMLPGGIGSLEEFFTTLTAKQLGQHAKPMVLLNTLSLYTPLRRCIEEMCEKGFIGKSCLEAFALADTPEEAVSELLRMALSKTDERTVSSYLK